ncbi:hypothetical protein BVX98_02555 [bacterium F11]|nr:hypothetical protein BVX98_02555 [bacterium F11]
MLMLPFAQNLILWRTSKGFSQEDLARAAALPRPNLSAIEKGHRDVTLKTVQALAQALDTRPGILVDGIPPDFIPPSFTWGRLRLERIARSVVSGAPLSNRIENHVRRHVTQVVQSQLRLIRGRKSAPPRGTRRTAVAWLWLRSHLPASVIESLIKRISEHAKKTN